MRQTEDFLPTEPFRLSRSVAPWHPSSTMLQIDPAVKLETYPVEVQDGKIPTVVMDWDLAKAKGD